MHPNPADQLTRLRHLLHSLKPSEWTVLGLLALFYALGVVVAETAWSPALPLSLLVPGFYYQWRYRVTESTREPWPVLPSNTRIILGSYCLVYLLSLWFVPILGSMVLLWLVQFTLPVILLRRLRVPLGNLGFNWRNPFRNNLDAVLVAMFLLPLLVFGARDASLIQALATHWYFPFLLLLSIASMALTVALPEEFVFRGLLPASVRSDRRWILPVGLSALIFALYHLPMRYLNGASPFHQELLGALGAVAREQLLLGLLLGYAVFKSHNLWHGIWLHAFINGFSQVASLARQLGLLEP
ncbi:MAG: hypothetical protein A2284_18060 [Deltaproteobacteria bacterium RIFOXYA12_FULL_61_11]|nr:MAG: hypothetical protein A2284_18060 [Deltaproteobacteria bacterium RIFOXYA12_FULL_61_11]